MNVDYCNIIFRVSLQYLKLLNCTMDVNMQNQQTTSVDMLDNMSFNDLETVKVQLETVRQRILQLQNAQSPLFRLPGELRNRIFLFAMHAELEERKKQGRHGSIFKEPAFFSLSRLVKVECSGVWFSDVLVWEEFNSTEREWRVLPMVEIRAMCVARSKVGQLTLVTQPSHCDLMRTRESVEGSRSICPRKGLARVKNGSCVCGLRWWVW